MKIILPYKVKKENTSMTGYYKFTTMQIKRKEKHGKKESSKKVV